MSVKKSRDRSVLLDMRKVRELALQKGLTSFEFFNATFFEYKGLKEDDKNPTAPNNAWYGKPIDKNRATEIAVFLGEANYHPLLLTSPPDIICPERIEWNESYSPPGALLKAEYEIVPFHQRNAELEDLESWCNSEERLSIRLYTGAGGMGKTRLAIEQCQRLVKQKKQWEAGLLRYFSKAGGPSRFTWLETEDRPIFVVIDYAETRREEVVAFIQSSFKSKTKIRLMLLSRAAADWWNILKTESQGVGDLLMSKATSWISLQPMSLDNKKREKSWFLAADSFAHCLKQGRIMDLPSDLDLCCSDFERVLLLHMQALVTVEGDAAEEGKEGILEVILNRERRFWEKQLDIRGLPKSYQSAISIAVARIKLIEGIKDSKDAIRVLDNIPILLDSKNHELQSIIELLHEVYPSQQSVEEGGNFIDPLQPDLLGEYLIKVELERDENSILDYLS